MLRRFIPLLIGSLSLPFVFNALDANAQVPPDVYKTSSGSIVAKNLTPNAPVNVEWPNLPTERTITADFCGQVSVSSTATAPLGTTITLDPGGTPTTITLATLPVLARPSCVNNVLSEARATNYITPTGTVVIVGRTPGIRYTVGIDGVPFRASRRPNACNFLTVNNEPERPIGTTLIVGTTTYTVASLTTSEAPTCRSGASGSTMYVPSTWLLP